MLMAHKKSYVTVKLTKRRYSSEIAEFDMSTLHSYFLQHMQYHEATRFKLGYCQ